MKYTIFLITLISLVFIVTFEAHNKEGFYLTRYELEEIKKQKQIEVYNTFRRQLGFLESSNNYTAVSPSGTYLGKYQFGPDALEDIGLSYTEDFLYSEELQELALLKYLKLNKKYLLQEVQMFVGEVIGGIKITEAGLLAAAHLGGAKSVKVFLYSGEVIKDGNGTPVTKYMRAFSDFNLNIDNINLEKEDIKVLFS